MQYKFALNTGCIDERSIPDTVTVNEASLALNILQTAPHPKNIINSLIPMKSSVEDRSYKKENYQDYKNLYSLHKRANL